jgi:hypothetical protein
MGDVVSEAFEMILKHQGMSRKSQKGSLKNCSSRRHQRELHIWSLDGRAPLFDRSQLTPDAVLQDLFLII